MLGLAALTVFLLLWLPLLRRRGSSGPVASGALRSASPLLFGLGGWFTGVLVVLMAQCRPAPANHHDGYRSSPAPGR